MKENVDITTQLLDFNSNPLNDAIRNYYDKPNMWKILGVERKELNHSQFLAWMLNSEFGGEKIFLKQFVNLLLRNGCKSIDDNEDLKALRTAVIQNSLKIVSCSIKTECPINSLSRIRVSDRLDIYVNAEIEGCGDKHSHLELIIENKINSKEGRAKDVLKGVTDPTEEEILYKEQSQTERYYYACSKQDGLRLPSEDLVSTIQAFVYLSVYGKGKNYKAKEDKFINISYQDLVDYVIEPLKGREDLDTFTQQSINDYLKNLCNPLNTTKMAITETEKELLKDFYDRNESLILAALEVMINDEDATEEQKETYRQIKENAQNSRKMRRFFSINNGLSLKMFQVVAEFVCYKLGKGVTIEDVESEIKECTKEISVQHVSTDKSKVRRGENSYEFNFQGVTYYVTKEWGLVENSGRNFEGFMQHVNKTYPDFRIVLL